MFSSLPQTQALASDFRLAPQYRNDPSSVLTVPELYDWHYKHNPRHALFLYDGETDARRIQVITMRDAVRAMYKTAFHVSELVADPRNSSEAISLAKPVIAVLAATGECTFERIHYPY
jgi:hypothetical protein